MARTGLGWLFTTLCLLAPLSGHAAATLTPYPATAAKALEGTLDPALLPARARLEGVETGQVFRLAGTPAPPLLLVPVTYSIPPGPDAIGNTYGCGLYLGDATQPRAMRFVQTYNRDPDPDAMGECGSLAAVGLQDKVGPHPRVILIYNAYFPPRHSWQQPIVLTWDIAANTYVVAPKMPDQANDMTARWTVGQVRRLLK